MDNKKELSREEQLALAKDEVWRVFNAYKEDCVCWDEYAESVYLDSRLSLDMQVQVYGELCNLLEDDSLLRINKEDDIECSYNLTDLGRSVHHAAVCV